MTQGKRISPDVAARIVQLLSSPAYRNGELTIVAITKRLDCSKPMIAKIRKQMQVQSGVSALE